METQELFKNKKLKWHVIKISDNSKSENLGEF